MKSDPAFMVRKFNGASQVVFWGRNVLLGLSGAVLVFAPLAYGAVHNWAYFSIGLVTAVISFVLAAGGLYQLAINPQNLRFWPYPPLWWFAAGLLILLVLQLMPIPAETLRLISPAAWEVRTLGNEYALAGFLPLSLNPYATQLEALKLWPALVLFFILLYTIDTRKKLLGFVGLILLVAVFEVTYGFWQYWHHSIWGWKNPWGGNRLCGTFINSNHLAAFLAMAILLGFGLFLAQRRVPASFPQDDSKRPRARTFLRPELFEPEARRFLLLSLLFLLAIGLIFTGSRGGMISLIIGFTFMALLIWSQRWKKGPILLLPIFLIAAFSYSLFLGSGAVLVRFLDYNFEGRLQAFQGAVALFRKFPWFGSGLATFGDLFYRFEPAQFKMARFIYTHNDWLQLLAETGLAGFLLVLFAWCTFFFISMKKWQNRQEPFASGLVLGGLSAMAAGCFHALMDFPFHIPAFSLLFSSVAALTYLAVHSHKGIHEHFSYPTLKACRPALIACLLVGLMLIQIIFCVQIGYIYLAEVAAPTEINSVRLPIMPTEDDYRRAISLDDRNSKYFLGLAGALARQKSKDKKVIREEEEALKRAVFLAPADWTVRLALAEFNLRQWRNAPARHIPVALQEFAAAVKLFPESAFLNYRLATVLAWAKKFYHGLVPPELLGRQGDYLEKALRPDPSLKKSHADQENRAAAP